MQFSLTFLVILATYTVAHALPGLTPTGNGVAERYPCAKAGCTCYCDDFIHKPTTQFLCAKDDNAPSITNLDDCRAISSAFRSGDLSIWARARGRGGTYGYGWGSCYVQIANNESSCSTWCPSLLADAVDYVISSLLFRCNGKSMALLYYGEDECCFLWGLAVKPAT